MVAADQLRFFSACLLVENGPIQLKRACQSKE